MGNNKQNDSSSDAGLMMIFLGVVAIMVSKNIDKMQRWADDHWMMLAVMGVGVCYVISYFMKWRFRMKHPESYERELALKQMQIRQKRNFDE